MLQKIKALVVSLGCIGLFFCIQPRAAWADSSDQGVAYARSLSSAFAKVAETITPSIVNVSAIRTTKAIRSSGQFNDPYLQPFLDFFGEDFSRQFGYPEGPAQQGLGTGVIVDQEGHILTNNHVIGEADQVRVRLHDGRSFKAEIVGTDPGSDLAVIKINADNLRPARLGDSDRLVIGEWVIAAGNPFGLENTITTGIVSAKGRSISGGNQYEDYIQTDAAINPGNSGGPLVNLAGEVVGINTAIFSRSGGYMGIGFAIPSNMARSVKESLIKEGRVVRGWLGVGIQNLTKELAESFNYTGTGGALVGHIDPKGPAHKSDLKQGDIIIAFNNSEISDTNQLRNMVAATRPGSTVELTIIRDGRKRDLSLVIGTLPSAKPPAQTRRSDSAERLGLSLETLTAELARRLSANSSEGVVVMAVAPGSLASRAGLQRGDIIVNADGKTIRSVNDFTNYLTARRLKRGVRLLVESRGMQHFILIKDDD